MPGRSLSFTLGENVAMSAMDVSPDIIFHLHFSVQFHLTLANNLSVISCAGRYYQRSATPLCQILRNIECTKNTQRHIHVTFVYISR